MWKRLFSLILFGFTWVAPASAQADRIYWADRVDLQPETDLFEMLDKGRMLAKLAYAPDGAPGFLANQHREVIYFGAGIHFKPGTYFAAFPDMHPSGDPSRVLVLSDGGYWAFIRTHRLVWEEDLPSGIADTAKALVATAPRMLSLANDRGAYLPQVSACNKGRAIRDDEEMVLEAKPGLGIYARRVPMGRVGDGMVRIPMGSELTRAFFMEEGGGQTIEILDRRPCNWERRAGKYVFEVSINGQRPIRLRPGDYNGAYPYDPYTNRAVISCAKHRDSYFDYLVGQLGIPLVFAPVVASLTGRWNRFEWFDDCTVR